MFSAHEKGEESDLVRISELLEDENGTRYWYFL